VAIYDPSIETPQARQLERAAASNRQAWWSKFYRIGWWEGLISGVSAEIRLTSNTPGSDSLIHIFLTLAGIVKKDVNLFYTHLV